MKKKSFILMLMLCMLLGYTTSYGEDNHYIVYTWGSSGATVKDIQKRLKIWGYYTGNISGTYDYDTFYAVKSFQKDNKMEQTGITDETVLKIMGISSSYASGSETLNKENEIWLIASVIEGETKNAPYHQKVAVGAVIVNRVKDTAFPATVASVVYQPDEFENMKKPSNLSIQAARDAVNGFDPSGGALYFWEKGKEKDKQIAKLPAAKIIGTKHFGSRG